MTQDSVRRFRPVIRVFVSSTFSDLKHERNALQEYAFPKLEELCAQNGFQFQAIDLRWGVPSEAGLDHRTMRICFDELRRSQEISPRPNFLILLGNRYGWRPLPEEISVDEFRLLERTAAQVATTRDKPATAVLQEWYRQDENAVPPVYLLQSRRQQIPDAKDYTQDGAWNEIQAILWEIINRAEPPEELLGRFDVALTEGLPPVIVRLQASATEQEIWYGALSVPDAQEHVLAFFREIENVGEFSDPAWIKDFVDLAASGKADESLRAQQDLLKAALRSRLGSANVSENYCARLTPARDAQGRPTTDVTTDHLMQLCADVEGRLTRIIRGQMEEYWNKTAPASAERAARELKIEQDEHERFGRERGGAKSFVGRQSELQAIRDYVRNDSPWPLVVHGALGCGKTALLARAAEEIQKSEVSGHKPELIVRFIGVTPRSSDIRSLLGSLCQELRLRHPREGELPADIKALGEELQEHFRSATPEQPLILFLDALDQISVADSDRLLSWIPAGQLPDQVKLVISCLSDRAEGHPAGQPFAELTRRQLSTKNSINLDALSEDEASTLLFHRWLPQAGRTVSQDQRERIGQYLKSKECRQPIYLKLLFEETRLWRSYDAVSDLGENVPAILSQLIERLSRPANHHPLLVERVLSYLAASRHGLAENEILEVLFADPDYKAALDRAAMQTRHELPASATCIPVAIWSRLRFDLAPYLTERAAPGANVLTFYHRQVAEWVQEYFVRASEHSWQPHRRLADYFASCAKGTDPQKEWESDSVRGFAECIYQLIKSRQHEQAAGLLSNFPFLLHKLRVGLLESVFEDYNLLRREAPAGVAKQIWADFFHQKAHILRRGNEDWPAHKILLQLSIEHADDSRLTIEAEKWLAEDHCDWLWLRRIPRLPHTQKTSCIAALEAHSGSVNDALVLAEGRLLSCSDDKTLRVWDEQRGVCLKVLQGHVGPVNGMMTLADGRLLSWAGWGDNTLRLWDGQSGACLKVLQGHTDSVNGALALADGRLLSWAGWNDNTLRLWDGERGACLAVLQGHTSVWGALVLADGRLLSWAGRDDNTLRLWDGQSGACLAVLQGHADWVRGALVLADGRLLSWSDDKTLRVWDGQSGACLKVLEGHTSCVGGALSLADGRLLSWSNDKLSRDNTLRLWRVESGACQAVLQGHTGGVFGALVLSDGRLLSWSDDKTLRVWDGQSGACLNVLKGHNSYVRGALVLADGRLLSRSVDGTLRVWDGQSGECLALLSGHTSSVDGVLELSDGRLLSWSSDHFSRDNTLRLWDSHNGHCLAVLAGHSSPVSGALSLTGGHIVSFSRMGDNTLRLWDGQSGACLAVLEGHTYTVDNARALGDGNILSWSDDTLRLWDGHNGQCIAVLAGHSSIIWDALALADGNILSWSGDHTLRLWDARSGKSLAVLKGHSDSVSGASALSGGEILSWSEDGTVRRWDGYSGQCLAVLKGHSAQVVGARELADGRILSWSLDKTLRLWNGQSQACLKVLRGHTSNVQGALALADGRLLSWSGWPDSTLRLWDGESAACLVVLQGHTRSVNGALVLADGRLLSWSDDKTLRLWDVLSGADLEVVSEDQVARRHPEWLRMLAKVGNPGSVFQDFYVGESSRAAFLRQKNRRPVLAVWNADSFATARCLLPDGTVVVSQVNGQVCFLKLQCGNRRIALAEVEEI